jgi:hypothetical protein
MAKDYGQRPFVWFENAYPTRLTEYEKLVFDMTIHSVGNMEEYRIHQEAKRKAKEKNAAATNTLDPKAKGKQTVSVQVSPEQRRKNLERIKQQEREEREAKRRERMARKEKKKQ